MFGILKNRESLLITSFEALDGAEHAAGQGGAGRPRWMTSRAGGLIARTEHRVAGFKDGVVAVTSGATGNTHLCEDLAMAALVEELRIDRMALAANVHHRRYARRRGAMIAVAIVTCRRRKIAFDSQRFPMHALFVLIDLTGRNLVGRHVISIGVT